MGRGPETWTERHLIRSSEADPRGRASVPAVCECLQEAAGSHAQALGVGIQTLFEQGLTWVLARLHLQIDRYPLWRDEIVVTTWPSSLADLSATRDFEILDGRDEPVGRATTQWMMVDVRRHRPVRMPPWMQEIRRPSRPRAIDDPFTALPRIESPEHAVEFAVRWRDLDLNGHVNHVSYVEWVVESAPIDLLQHAGLTALEVQFRAECHYGTTVTVERGRDADGALIHRVTGGEGARDLALARTRWQDGG